MAARSSPESYAADRTQAKLGNCGKQEAGLLDRFAAAGEDRRRAPQLALNEGMARQGFGVIAEQKDQSRLARGGDPDV